MLLYGKDASGNRNFKIESADFNLDGRPDLVTSDAEGKRVYVMLQDENGLFRATPPGGLLFGGGGPNLGPFTLAVGDFNEDGHINTADYIVWRKQIGQQVAAWDGALYVPGGATEQAFGAVDTHEVLLP